MRALKKFIVSIFSSWYKNGALKEGAALSFYTVLSLPALVIGITSLATLFFEKQKVQDTILLYSSFSFGQSGQEVIRSIIQEIPKNSLFTLTTAISIFFLFLTASGIFSSLQDALAVILQEPAAPLRIKNFLKNRIFLFLIVLSLGFILVVTTFLQSLFSFGATHLTEFFLFSFDTLKLLTACTNFLLFILITAFLFRSLPQKKQTWQAVWFGSLICGILFTLGKYFLSLYIAQANFGSAYGAAGSLMALLVWIYYSSQTLFLGAECMAEFSK